MSRHFDSTDERVRSTAQSLVAMAAAALGTDAASLWWYDQEKALLVGRYPEDRMPTVKVFSDMPDIGASIRAGETQLYVRSEATGAVREWMDRAGVAVSLRLPVEGAVVSRHFLGLSWETDDHPPVESILPMAQRVANHIALALTRVVDRHVKVESALELSDNVAQALVIAKAALELDRTETALQAIDRALDEVQRIMGRLARDDDTGTLRRMYASDTLGQQGSRPEA